MDGGPNRPEDASNSGRGRGWKPPPPPTEDAADSIGARGACGNNGALYELEEEAELVLVLVWSPWLNRWG